MARMKRGFRYYGNSALKQWFLCEFGLSSGLRISEIRNILAGHIFIDSPRPYIWVECGKGGKARKVEVDYEFCQNLKLYLAEKKRIREPGELSSPLFYSKHSKGKYNARALRYMFKKSLETAGIRSEYSIHCLRHTYALALYKATKFNILHVQKQLGHSSIRITEIYLQALTSELQKPLRRLY